MAVPEIKYEDLEYGAYSLEYEEGSEVTEAVKYSGYEFNKLYARKLRLPDGKGNVIYIMSNTFENSLKCIISKHFTIPANYRRVYFPWWYVGKLNGKRFKVSTKNLMKERRDQIKDVTNMMPYQMRNLNSCVDNVFFITSDIISAMQNIMKSYPLKRNYTEFFTKYNEVLKSLTPTPSNEGKGPEWNNRLIIIDCDAFAFTSGDINSNKINPLFLLYIAYLRNKNLSSLNADIDMLICSNNKFLKFNPSKLDDKMFTKFRMALFKIMGSDLDAIADSIKDEVDITSTDHIVKATVNKVTEPYTKMVSPSVKSILNNSLEDKFREKAKEVLTTDQEIKKAVPDIEDKKDDPFIDNLKQVTSFTKTNPTKNPLSDKQVQMFKAVAGDNYEPLTAQSGSFIDDDYDEDEEENLDNEDELLNDQEDVIEDDITDIMVNDDEVKEEVLDEIQDKKIAPKNSNQSPISSARDAKLREKQKQVIINNSTIGEILERDTNSVPIISEDKSAAMHTINKNVKQITFANFDKTYIDNLMMKDLVACFDQLKDKNTPFYITGIEIKDSSDSLNYKETWKVHLVDEINKRYTITVDIPKFKNDRFMYIDGTKWIIFKQNLYLPIVKDTPDTVVITASTKIFVGRKATKSLSSINRILNLIKKSEDTKTFISGNSAKGNEKYISTLEYDEFSKFLFRFKSKTCDICFSRSYIDENNLGTKFNIKGNEFYIGTEGNEAIIINEDTGLDRRGRTISEIIMENLPEEDKAILSTIKGPKESMYADAKLVGKRLPIITALIVWIGLSKTLDTMGIKWEFHHNYKKVPAEPEKGKSYIKFSNGVLEYESVIFADLILNGLVPMHPEKFQFEDFDTEVGYDEFIRNKFSNYNGINELKNMYEFLVDPITKDVCKDLLLPETAEGLMIYAVKLLADNKHVSKASDTSFRVRSIEIIPAILNKHIANQYKMHVRSGRRIPMTLKQNCVIQTLINEKTVEAYSTLNPAIEVTRTHTISTKGYTGSNSDFAYKDKAKRSYDESSVGKIAISTNPDAGVGITRNLVVEPTITNARGYRAPTDIEDLKDVNIFAPVEMLTPGTAKYDDPVRTAISAKQSGHVVPVAGAVPSLVSNGYDEAVQYHLSDDFVINAEEDGKVIDVNEKLGFIMVEYKSGKTRAISTNVEMVYNSGGGFYMPNKLIPIYTKVGDTFKKDEPLAYHEKYFKYSKMNGLRYAIGPLVKVAFLSSYNTYEDGGVCTEKLSEEMASSIVYLEEGLFKRNNNILDIVKIGDHVSIGDPLIRFDVSTEDDELSKYLSKLSEENQSLLTEETKDTIKSKHAGKIIDIKVYSLLDPENLSPSLAKIVKEYFAKGINKEKYLNKFDSSPGIMKSGYMLTDTTGPTKNKYGVLNGRRGIDVLIEFYIEHSDFMGNGDKLAQYNANKQIVSEFIPKGYEPYSEFRPDEEISAICSPGTVMRRMTVGSIPIASAGKVLIELKRKIKENIKYKN